MHPSRIRLQTFISSDRDLLVQAINAVCAEGMMATPSFMPTSAWLHALETPQCPHHLLLVAWDDELLIGWCRAFPESPGLGAEIGLGLLPEYRGLGFGKLLLDRTVAWASKCGLNRLSLLTRVGNERAIALFKKVGFFIAENQSENELLMILDLKRASVS